MIVKFENFESCGLTLSFLADVNENQLLTANFAIREAANKSCTDNTKLVITPQFLAHAEMLQTLRNYWGKPMTVNSWYREKEFNKKVGGIATSNHLKGTATDIALPNLSDANYTALVKAWQAITTAGGTIGEVGRYDWGLHFGSFTNNSTKFCTFDKRTK